MSNEANILLQIKRIHELLNQHQIQLNPPLSDQDIQFYEKENQATLPDEYRLFLNVIGNGGKGPYYGLYPLGKVNVEVHLQDNQLEKRLVLCHEGCGYYFSLLCTGPHTGIMTYDHGSEEEPAPYERLVYGYGMYGVHYTFLDWYEHWLLSGAKTSQDLLRELEPGNFKQ